MKLDAECGCGAAVHLDSGTSGPGDYPYVPENKVGEMFAAWMKEHQPCRTKSTEPICTCGSDCTPGPVHSVGCPSRIIRADSTPVEGRQSGASENATPEI